MKKNKNFGSLSEASEFLGEDFWNVMSDIIPFIGPRVDVIRTTMELIIIAELPGIMSQADLAIKQQGSLLLIEGEITRPYLQNHVQIVQDERFNGPFKRKIRLPEDCNIEKISATYVNGLLKITIPLYNDEPNVPKQEIPIRFVKNNFMMNGDGMNDKN